MCVCRINGLVVLVAVCITLYIYTAEATVKNFPDKVQRKLSPLFLFKLFSLVVQFLSYFNFYYPTYYFGFYISPVWFFGKYSVYTHFYLLLYVVAAAATCFLLFSRFITTSLFVVRSFLVANVFYSE